jgi:hypothetical protein
MLSVEVICSLRLSVHIIVITALIASILPVLDLVLTTSLYSTDYGIFIALALTLRSSSVYTIEEVNSLQDLVYLVLERSKPIRLLVLRYVSAMSAIIKSKFSLLALPLLSRGTRPYRLPPELPPRAVYSCYYY